MNDLIYVNIAVEDDLSDVVLRKVIEDANPNIIVNNCYGKRGSVYLKSKISGFNNASKSIPYVVLTDLDNEECAPKFINE